MAKKNKRNIKALLAKRAELQSIGQKPMVSIPGAPRQSGSPTPVPSITTTAPNVALPAHHETASKEIWRTVTATAVIAVLLAAVVLTDKRYHYLDSFGHTIYQALELGS